MLMLIKVFSYQVNWVQNNNSMTFIMNNGDKSVNLQGIETCIQKCLFSME